jgi:hypothetical protein
MGGNSLALNSTPAVLLCRLALAPTIIPSTADSHRSPRLLFSVADTLFRAVLYFGPKFTARRYLCGSKPYRYASA